jgi:hypothetical protein
MSVEKVEKKVFLRAFSVLIGIGVLFGSSYVFSSKTQANAGFVPIPTAYDHDLKRVKGNIFDTKRISLHCSTGGENLSEFLKIAEFSSFCVETVRNGILSNGVKFNGYDDNGNSEPTDLSKREEELFVSLVIQPLLLSQWESVTPQTGGDLSDLYSITMKISRKFPVLTTPDLVQTVVFPLPNKPEKYERYKEEILEKTAFMLNVYFVRNYNELHKNEKNKTIKGE